MLCIGSKSVSLTAVHIMVYKVKLTDWAWNMTEGGRLKKQKSSQGGFMFIAAVSIPWRLHCFTVFTIIMKIYSITVNREIFALFYFRPFCLDVVSGRILRRGKLPCLKLSLSNHNFVWVNSRWGKTVCMGRLVTTFFRHAKNKLVYGILQEEQCAKGINILRKHQLCNCNILSVILR